MTDTSTPTVPPVVQTIEDKINDVANDPIAQAIGERVTPKIPQKVRGGIYEASVIIGSIAAGAAGVAAATEGNVQLVSASIAGLALALVAFLAKTHLSDPPAK